MSGAPGIHRPVTSEWRTHGEGSLDEYIVERPYYTLVDFRLGDARQIAEIYRVLGARLLESAFDCVLFKSGSDNSDGHHTLCDVLRTLLRIRERPAQLKLALLAGTPQLARAFQRMQREFRMTGFELRVVQTEAEAEDWFRN